MIPDRDMDTDYDHPDVVMPWNVILFTAAWGLALALVIAPLCGAALLGVRLRTLALRALGRPVATRPTLEELAGRGGGPRAG